MNAKFKNNFLLGGYGPPYITVTHLRYMQLCRPLVAVVLREERAQVRLLW